MFKLVVLSCLVSVAFAGHIAHPVQYTQVKHIVEPQISVVETPTINHVGSVVKNIPTGVSHHSNSVVHSAANVVEPIYAHGVEKSIISTPIVKNVVEHVQAVQYAAPAVHYAAAPAAHYAAAPVAHYAAAPAVHYAAAPAVHYAPAVHAEPIYAKAAYVQQPIAYSAYAPKALSYSSVAHHQPAHYAQAYAPAAYSAYSAYPSAQYAHHY